MEKMKIFVIEVENYSESKIDGAWKEEVRNYSFSWGKVWINLNHKNNCKTRIVNVVTYC